MYCKYCYRMLEDGTEICTACGKSQTTKKKNPRKLLGLFPIYSEKDAAEAKKLFCHAEAAYKLARESKTVLDFIVCWNMLQQDNATLRTYQEIIPPEAFQQFSDILSKESEFQWRLRDAIEASKLATISDIKGEYRNNAGPRASSFFDDLEYVSECASPETADFALSALNEVTNLVGGKVNNSASIIRESLRSLAQGMLDEFATYGSVDAELLSIDLMDGHDFERWCANVLCDLGYSNVEVTPGSGDQGVDVLAEKDSIRYAIQCKCYSSNLGNTPIQEVSAGKSFYRCHVGVVMTNRHFTPKAKELADATGTLLWDRDWITGYLNSKVSVDSSLYTNRTSRENTPVNTSVYFSRDNILPAAVGVVLETGQASVSMLQRRLKLGYTRAAQIMDTMEEMGIVGPFQGSKPREILITKEQWRRMQAK